MDNQESVFKIEDLNLWYGDKHVLKDVNLEIPRQGVTAIIGPSGCGKSSFLKILNRMVDQVSSARCYGKVWFNGRNILDNGMDLVKLRSEIGMVFQQPNPFPKSIFENVAFGPRVHGERNRQHLNEIVEKSLRAAALWDEVNGNLYHPAFSLSGGQQQRLCIARALAVGPKILLMDEPCSALDPVATSRIEDLIDSLQETYPILIVTHNMQQAARISHKTAFFLQGEIIEFNSTSEFFTNPRDQRTEDYITGRFG